MAALLLVGPGLTGHVDSQERRARMARLAEAARRGGDQLARAWLQDRHLAPHGFSAEITRLVRQMLRDNCRSFSRRPGPFPCRRRCPGSAGSSTLWGALSERAAAFHIAADRHERQLPDLIGTDFAGIVCSDRWWATTSLMSRDDTSAGRTCCATFAATRRASLISSRFGAAGLEVCRALFVAWGDFHEHGERERLAREIAPLKRTLEKLLERAATKSTKNRRIRTFARNLLKLWPALWTFAEVEGVEPTNNRAERGLRGAVIYRKISLGSQSEAGERFAERMLWSRRPAASRVARCSPT